MSDFLDLQDDPSLRRALFVGAILLCVIPFLQAASQLWPFQFGDIRWRFGAANSFSAVLLLPFLGFTFLMVIARAIESSAMSKVIGIIAVFFTLLLLASFIVFVLDALQLKKIVSTQMETAFDTTSIRVALVTMVFVVAFLMLAIAGFQGPKSLAVRGGTSKRGPAPTPRRSEAGDDPGSGLIVGR